MTTTTTYHWVPAGSRISGENYAAALMTDIARGRETVQYGVALLLGGSLLPHNPRLTRVQPVADQAEADDLMLRFCHVCRQWNVAQNRARALAQGWALLG
jgi:hypothetical protein